MESDLPHLICIDDDILSTGVTLYHLNVSLQDFSVFRGFLLHCLAFPIRFLLFCFCFVILSECRS